MSSSTFRFVHAADLHLDAPFHGLRHAPPAFTHALGQAPLKAWDALVQLTLDQNAAFLLLAGGICDGGERAIPAQLRFLEGLQRLAAAGIRTFIVRGQDDPADRWPAIQRWPEGVHCFGAQAPESIAVRTAGGHMVTIHGISHSPDHVLNRIGRLRRGPEAGIHIALFHGSVKNGDAAPGDHASAHDLQSAGMDYWALGHDHRYRQLSAGRPWVVYPGTLQGRTLKGDDTGPKGAVVATVSDGVVSSAVHHELDAIRLLRTQVDASTLAGPTDFRRALAASAPQFREEGAGRTVIASCDVFGRRQGWMGTQIADGVWDRVLDEVRQEQSAGDGFIWWDSVVDLTDARESQPQSDAATYVHQLVEVFRRAPAGIDRLLTDHSVAPGVSSAAGYSSLDSVELNALLTKAERVALSLLEPNEP